MDQETKKEFEDLTLIIRDSFGELESKTATKEDLLGVKAELLGVKEDLRALDNRLSSRIDSMESRMATKEDLERFATKDDLAGMETRMVSKSYLDDKLSDFRSICLK